MFTNLCIKVRDIYCLSQVFKCKVEYIWGYSEIPRRDWVINKPGIEILIHIKMHNIETEKRKKIEEEKS